MRRSWKKLRYRLEWFGLKLLTSLAPRLPRRGVIGLANLIGWVAYAFDRRGRSISLANIAAAFGPRFSSKARARIVRRSYCNFARTMCDLFGSRVLTRDNFREYLKIENVEVLRRLRERGESAVVMCMHLGNFEWASLAAGFEGFPAMIVTESFKNPRLNRFFKRCREISGHETIPQESSMLRLLKRVRRGGMAGVLVDLNQRPGQASTIIDAFGLKMCVTILHTVLAQRGPARLVPVEGQSQADGSCRVIFHNPLELPAGATQQQIAQVCWDFFAPKIAADPEQWLWAYKHWRYKPSATNQNYPWYAHTCEEFDRMLAASEITYAETGT